MGTSTKRRSLPTLHNQLTTVHSNQSVDATYQPKLYVHVQLSNELKFPLHVQWPNAQLLGGNARLIMIVKVRDKSQTMVAGNQSHNGVNSILRSFQDFYWTELNAATTAGTDHRLCQFILGIAADLSRPPSGRKLLNWPADVLSHPPERAGYSSSSSWPFWVFDRVYTQVVREWSTRCYHGGNATSMVLVLLIALLA
jgi:hypothetical protein